MSDTARSFDMVIVGAGPGGYVSAIRAAQLGLSVAIVEKDNPGGVCLNIGCIPSKALIHQAGLFKDGKALLEKAGAKIDLSGFDYKTVWRSSRLAAERLSKGVQFLLKKNKIELVKGLGSIAGADKVKVATADGELLLSAKAIVLATGSRPRSLPGFSIDEERILSSTGILMSEKLPASLAILGAGAIGMEFAYVMRAFGVEVTVLELLDHALPLEDAESAKIVEKAFASYGVKIHTQAKAKSATIVEGGVRVDATDSTGKDFSVEAEKLLVSVGRAPNTDSLGLESVGVRTTKGYIETGDYYETSAAGIYAIGDITIQPQLAHVASKAGEIVAERIAQLLKETPAPAEKRVDPLAIPSAVYCEPEVASFGLSEAKAVQSGIAHAVARFPYRGIGKAVATEAPEGQVKIVHAPETGAILGASIVGIGATDTIHELLLASRAELTVEEVADLIHAHPTLSEGLMEAAKAALGRAIHV